MRMCLPINFKSSQLELHWLPKLCKKLLFIEPKTVNVQAV